GGRHSCRFGSPKIPRALKSFASAAQTQWKKTQWKCLEVTI
ncbi:hypothetical protein M5D96_004923, partial [Drosophila gunungcola]